MEFNPAEWIKPTTVHLSSPTDEGLVGCFDSLALNCECEDDFPEWTLRHVFSLTRGTSETFWFLPWDSAYFTTPFCHLDRWEKWWALGLLQSLRKAPFVTREIEPGLAVMDPDPHEQARTWRRLTNAPGILTRHPNIKPYAQQVITHRQGLMGIPGGHWIDSHWLKEAIRKVDQLNSNHLELDMSLAQAFFSKSASRFVGVEPDFFGLFGFLVAESPITFTDRPAMAVEPEEKPFKFIEDDNSQNGSYRIESQDGLLWNPRSKQYQAVMAAFHKHYPNAVPLSFFTSSPVITDICETVENMKKAIKKKIDLSGDLFRIQEQQVIIRWDLITYAPKQSKNG